MLKYVQESVLSGIFTFSLVVGILSLCLLLLCVRACVCIHVYIYICVCVCACVSCFSSICYLEVFPSFFYFGGLEGVEIISREIWKGPWERERGG